MQFEHLGALFLLAGQLIAPNLFILFILSDCLISLSAALVKPLSQISDLLMQFADNDVFLASLIL